MSILFGHDLAVLDGVVGVQEAEELLEWLQRLDGPRVDLAGCTHLHAASMQVLMAARPVVTAWPADAALAAWLRSALPPGPPPLAP